MPRTFLAALALIGLACGGDTKRPPAAAHRRAAAPAAPRPTTAKGKAQRKPTARSDTTTQRNPLINR